MVDDTLKVLLEVVRFIIATMDTSCLSQPDMMARRKLEAKLDALIEKRKGKD